MVNYTFTTNIRGRFANEEDHKITDSNLLLFLLVACGGGNSSGTVEETVNDDQQEETTETVEEPVSEKDKSDEQLMA